MSCSLSPSLPAHASRLRRNRSWPTSSPRSWREIRGGAWSRMSKGDRSHRENLRFHVGNLRFNLGNQKKWAFYGMKPGKTLAFHRKINVADGWNHEVGAHQTPISKILNWWMGWVYTNNHPILRPHIVGAYEPPALQRGNGGVPADKQSLGLFLWKVEIPSPDQSFPCVVMSCLVIREASLR